MINLSELQIRYSEVEDSDFLYKCLEDEENLYWFPMSSQEEGVQVARNWVNYFRFKSSLTATWQGKTCGIATLFLMPYKKTAHHGSFYIMVDKEMRRQGIGSTLLLNLLNLAKNYFDLEQVHIEVFQDSPLISLLLKKDFMLLAKQEHYVKINDKHVDKLLYARYFSPQEALL
jgi:RimJ/RimL family protein N-acetyltransferase